MERQAANNEIPKWSALLIEAVNRPQSLWSPDHALWHSHNGGTLYKESIGKAASTGHKASQSAFA